MSIMVENFEDFFIEEWRTKETREANRDALLALYNYLFNTVSKSKSQREIRE